MVTGYDVHHLTPAGHEVSHVDGAIETDGPWLLVWTAGPGTGTPRVVSRAWPAHAVYDLHACEGGDSCRARSMTG